MLAIIQRVDHAAVTVEGTVTGEIQKGLWILLGVFEDDTPEDVEILASKTANLRVFCDENDKMNLSALQVGASALVISNFTLCADTKKGTRPSFSHAMTPDTANAYYEKYCELLRCNGIQNVQKGVFGAHMQIDADCNGPVTICLNTEVWRRAK